MSCKFPGCSHELPPRECSGCDAGALHHFCFAEFCEQWEIPDPESNAAYCWECTAERYGEQKRFPRSSDNTALQVAMQRPNRSSILLQTPTLVLSCQPRVQLMSGLLPPRKFTTRTTALRSTWSLRSKYDKLWLRCEDTNLA